MVTAVGPVAVGASRKKAGLGIGGVLSTTTATEEENSLVLPSSSVAVAETTQPSGTSSSKLAVQFTEQIRPARILGVMIEPR